MIEIKHLRLVREIAETGSMTAASRKLFLTQPSLSHQLKEIESRLGIQLFLRVNKSMVLTDAGKVILAAAGEVLPKVAGVEKEIKGLQIRTREIRLSTKCYTCYHWLPALMKQFSSRMAEVEFDIVTEAMTDPVEYLLNGEIDVAIMNVKTAEKGIHFHKLFDDEQVLLVPKEHPLAGREFVRPKDFSGQHLIIYKEDLSSDYFAQTILIPAGIAPARVTKMQLTEARVELVKAGLGLTVLSRWLAQPFLLGDTSLRQISVGKSGFYRPWFLVTLDQRADDPVLTQFKEFLMEHQLGSQKKPGRSVASKP